MRRGEKELEKEIPFAMHLGIFILHPSTKSQYPIILLPHQIRGVKFHQYTPCGIQPIHTSLARYE